MTLGKRTIFLKMDCIDWIEANGNFLRLYVGGHSHLMRCGKSMLEKQLDPAKFARVHRSMIVYLERVRELPAVGPNDYRIIVADGTELSMIRSYRDRLPQT